MISLTELNGYDPLYIFPWPYHRYSFCVAYNAEKHVGVDIDESQRSMNALSSKGFVVSQIHGSQV